MIYYTVYYLWSHPISSAFPLSPSFLLCLLLLLVGEPSKGAGQGEKEGEDQEEDEQYHRDVVHRPDQDDGDVEDDQEEDNEQHQSWNVVHLPGGRFRFFGGALAVHLI